MVLRIGACCEFSWRNSVPEIASRCGSGDAVGGEERQKASTRLSRHWALHHLRGVRRGKRLGLRVAGGVSALSFHSRLRRRAGAAAAEGKSAAHFPRFAPPARERGRLHGPAPRCFLVAVCGLPRHSTFAIYTDPRPRAASSGAINSNSKTSGFDSHPNRPWTLGLSVEMLFDFHARGILRRQGEFS